MLINGGRLYSFASAPQAHRTHRISDAEWDQQKQRILDLYLKEGMTLPRVQEIMRKERGFEATYGEILETTTHATLLMILGCANMCIG